MNIIDAVKSGKRFKRKGTNYYSELSNDFSGIQFHRDDLLADDWEIEEPEYKITKSQLAYAVGCIPIQYSLKGDSILIFKSLLTHLGMEE